MTSTPINTICRHCERIIERQEYPDGRARWMHVDGSGGYWHCRAGTTAGPGNPEDEFSPSKQLKAFGNSLADALRDGLARPMSGAPMCPDHVERQHRDMKPPWCPRCGWTRGREAVPAAKHGEANYEKKARRDAASADRLGDVP